MSAAWIFIKTGVQITSIDGLQFKLAGSSGDQHEDGCLRFSIGLFLSARQEGHADLQRQRALDEGGKPTAASSRGVARRHRHRLRLERDHLCD